MFEENKTKKPIEAEATPVKNQETLKKVEINKKTVKKQERPLITYGGYGFYSNN